jgi:hypothetical protein
MLSHPPKSPLPKQHPPSPWAKSPSQNPFPSTPCLDPELNHLLTHPKPHSWPHPPSPKSIEYSQPAYENVRKHMGRGSYVLDKHVGIVLSFEKNIYPCRGGPPTGRRSARVKFYGVYGHPLPYPHGSCALCSGMKWVFNQLNFFANSLSFLSFIE